MSEIIPITFKWTINNFSYHLRRVGYKLISSTFSSENSRYKSKWHLEVYPQGKRSGIEDHLSLFLIFEADPKQEVTVMLQCYILSPKANILFSGEKLQAYQFSKTKSSWGYQNFITVDGLMDERSELVVNDTLTIYCEMTLATEAINKFGKTLSTKTPECRLGDDFSKLLDDEFLSDVILMAGGKQFKVHKAVLIARSSVFAAMFLNEMKEKNKDVIEIGDISDDVLGNLLRFIYSGKVPEETSVKMISDLLAAAEKYDLGRLKMMCEKILVPKLTIENAADLLVLADLHNAEELKTTAMDFVNTYVAAVKKMDNWKSLVQYHPLLLDEVFSCYVQRGLKVPDV